MQYKVTPKNAKERTRIAEHGDVWKTTTMPHASIPNRKLLESATTQYIRWWFVDQLKLVY